MPENAVRNSPGPTPTNSQGEPSASDKPNTDTEPNDGSIDNQRGATQNQGNDEQQQPSWRSRLGYIREHVGSAGFWLAIFTFFLVVETAFTIRVLITTDEALHQTAEATKASAKTADRIREITEADDRAWIVPLPPKITGTPIVGRFAQVGIPHQNVGRSPGSDIKISYFFDVVPMPDELNFSKMTRLGDDFCKTNPPLESLGIQYPNRGESTLFVNSSPVVWNEILQSHRELLRVRSCYSYQTFGQIRYAWSCFWIVPETRIINIPQNGTTTQSAPGVSSPSVAPSGTVSAMDTIYVAATCNGGQGGN